MAVGVVLQVGVSRLASQSTFTVRRGSRNAWRQTWVMRRTLDMVFGRLRGRCGQNGSFDLALPLSRSAGVWRQGGIDSACRRKLLLGLPLGNSLRSRSILRDSARVGILGRDGPGRGYRARETVGNGRYDARERATSMPLRWSSHFGS